MTTKLIKLCFYDDSEEEEEDDEEEESEEEVEKHRIKKKSETENEIGESENENVAVALGFAANGDEREKRDLGFLQQSAGTKRKHSDCSVKEENGSEAKSTNPPTSKIAKPRLPLPSALFSTSSSSTSYPLSSSSSSLVESRIRSFAHVRGNWASHVFLKPFVDDDDSMEELSENISVEAMKVFQKHSLPSVKVRTWKLEQVR